MSDLKMHALHAFPGSPHAHVYGGHTEDACNACTSTSLPGPNTEVLDDTGWDVARAWRALVDALDRLAAAGRVTPCQADPEAFTSDDLHARREARRACPRCPALEACGRFAESNREVWHVWAGRDRQSPIERKKP